MSIADKLVLVAENQQKVYDVGGVNKERAIRSDLDEALEDLGAEPVEDETNSAPFDLYIYRAYDEGHNQVIPELNAALVELDLEPLDPDDGSPSDAVHAAYCGGQRAEYDAFWDDFQLNGERHYYVQAFGGCWSEKTFRPKYDLAATGQNAFGMFRACNLSGSLKQMLADCGVSLTFDRCNNISSLFQEAYYITEIGELDFSTVTRLNCTQVFLSCQRLHTVDKIILPVGQTTFSSWFGNCNALENVTFEGVIGVNISFANSPLLSNASVQSVIDCLKNLAGGAAQTLTLHADVGAQLTEEQKADCTAKNWTLVY